MELLITIICILIFTAGFASGVIYEIRITKQDYKEFADDFSFMNDSYRVLLDRVIEMKQGRWNPVEREPWKDELLLIAVECDNDNLILEGKYVEGFMIYIESDLKPVSKIGTVKGWMYKAGLGFPE